MNRTVYSILRLQALNKSANACHGREGPEPVRHPAELDVLRGRAAAPLRPAAQHRGPRGLSGRINFQENLMYNDALLTLSGSISGNTVSYQSASGTDTSVLSTNTIDLGIARDIGEGQPAVRPLRSRHGCLGRHVDRDADHRRGRRGADRQRGR
jgi:hypothetical protein